MMDGMGSIRIIYGRISTCLGIYLIHLPCPGVHGDYVEEEISQ